MGRLGSKRYADEPSDQCMGSGFGGWQATYGYLTTVVGRGRLDYVMGGSGDGEFRDTFVYDNRGQVTSVQRAIGPTGASHVYNLTTAYDLLDRPTTLTYPGVETVTIGYDGEYPKSLQGSIGAMTMVSDLDYNERGQLTHVDRSGSVVDTSLLYYDQTKNFLLDELRHGTETDDIPIYLYNQYDSLGRLEIVPMKQSSNTETQTFGYDALGRLRSAKATGTPAGANYDYTYSYGSGGNLGERTNNTSGGTRTYSYDTTVPRHYHAVETISGDNMTANFVYDANGNMTGRTDNTGAYVQTFDVENRLRQVVEDLPDPQTDPVTQFYYDADGNRVLTVQPDGTKIYTPFPEYEESITSGGASTRRRSYTLAGQLMAVRTAGTLRFAFSDHLGSVVAWADST